MSQQSDVKQKPPFRVIAYVDGFNLYFGMRDKGWRRYYWLNIPALIQSLLLSNQALRRTRYFTSRIARPEDKRRRQAGYLDALGTLPNLDIFYGHYLESERKCRNCGYVQKISTEKMTDVNIATELLADAFADQFDTAVIVSADSDLVGPIMKVRQLFPAKRLVVAFPPGRQSVELRRAAHVRLFIESAHLAASQLPESIALPSGHILHRPMEWA